MTLFQNLTVAQSAVLQKSLESSLRHCRDELQTTGFKSRQYRDLRDQETILCRMLLDLGLTSAEVNVIGDRS